MWMGTDVSKWGARGGKGLDMAVWGGRVVHSCPVHVGSLNPAPPPGAAGAAHQAKQRADADVVNAANHGAVLAEQAVGVVALGAGHVHLGKGGAVVGLLEQSERAYLGRGGRGWIGR